MKFFLSYASDHDKKTAVEIKEQLEELNPSNPHEVFVDYEDLRKSQDTDMEINKLLEDVDAVLYLITVSSIRSFWCGKEIGYAQCLGKPIVPIAGPNITGEFIKSQSVPWIAGLKWVNWWEEERAQRIIDGVTHGRDVLRLLTMPEVKELSGAPLTGDSLAIGLANTRSFSVSDVSIGCELQMGGDDSRMIFRTPKNDVLRIMGKERFASIIPLVEFQRSDGKLTGAWIVERLKSKEINIANCMAVVLVRYCIGGQHYLSSVFDLPFPDVCCPDLRKALEKASA